MIDAAADLPLTLIAAGPGAGKTVLLSEWATTQPDPPAWLTLLPRHNDPVRFWKLFVASAQQAGRLDDESGLQLAGRITSIERLDWLDEFVQRIDGRLSVVLDDAHVLTDPDIIGGLDQIVRDTDSRIRLLISSRSDPLLPIYRYRLAGDMAEVRAADLAMTDDEAESLLHAHGVRLATPQLDVLTRRTERWVAGLRLSALRMEHSQHPETFVEEFALDQGSIGEYLVAEVLDRVAPAVQELLIQTSFIDELDVGLAECIVQRPDARADLHELSRTNSFITSIDSTGHRYRLHQLLQQTLRYLFLERQPQAARRELYLRAARWYADHGHWTPAMTWALHGGDPTFAGSMLTRGALAQAFVSAQSRSDLRRLKLDECDDLTAAPTTEDDGAAVSAYWAVRALTCDATGATSLLAELPRLDAAADSWTPDERATLELARLMMAELAGAHRIVEATAKDLVGRFPAVPGFGAMVLLAGAKARASTGSSDDIRPVLDESLRWAQADDAPIAEAEIWAFRAAVEIEDVRFKHGAEAIAEAERVLAAHDDLPRPMHLDVAIARRAYIEADAAALQQTALRLRADDAFLYAPDAALIEARVLTNSEQWAGARAVLMTDPVLQQRAEDVFAVARDAQLADMETRLGRPNAALRLIARYANGPLDVHTACPAARAHLALGDVGAARNRVRAVLTAGRHVSRLLVVGAILCDSAAALVEGDEAAAVGAAEHALQIADNDIVQPFVESVDRFVALLQRHPSVAERWPGGVAGEVLDAMPARAATAAVRADPLTERERAVLRLLCTDLSARDIADELCVSIHTVRTHQAAIYRKLGSRRRRDAVQQARTLELV